MRGSAPILPCKYGWISSGPYFWSPPSYCCDPEGGTDSTNGKKEFKFDRAKQMLIGQRAMRTKWRPERGYRKASSVNTSCHLVVKYKLVSV